MKLFVPALTASLALASAAPAFADEPVSYEDTVTLSSGATTLAKVHVTPTTPLPVTGGSGGTASGFTKDAGAAVTISATTATAAATALPGTGAIIWVTNAGPNEAECLQGATGVQAATTDNQVLPGQYALYGRGTAGFLSCITPTGTASLRVVTGAGDPRVGIATDLNKPSAVIGSTAAGSALSDPPVPSGCLAKTSLPAAQSDGSAYYQLCDKYGRMISPSILRENKGVQQTDVSTSETTIVTADASNKLELYCLVLANTNTTNPATATIKDATGGTTRGKFQIPAGDTRGFCVAADSGWPQAAVNNNWTVTLAGTSPAVSVTASFLKSGS